MMSLFLYRFPFTLLSLFVAVSGSGSASCSHSRSYSGFRIPDSGFPLSQAPCLSGMIRSFLSECLPTVRWDCVSYKMAEFCFARRVFMVFLCDIFTGLES